MGARSNVKAAPKSSASPAAIAASICLLLVIIGALGWYFLGNHQTRAAAKPLTQAETALQQLARRTKGDFNQLSPEERAQAIQQYGPSFPGTLHMTYAALANK